MVASCRHRDAIMKMKLRGISTKSICHQLNVHRNTVNRTLVRLRELGNTSDRKRNGRPPTAVTQRNVIAVRKRISRNSHRSIRAMATELGMSRRSMGRIVKYALKMKPYRVQKSSYSKWLKQDSSPQKVQSSPEEDAKRRAFDNCLRTRNCSPSKPNLTHKIIGWLQKTLKLQMSKDGLSIKPHIPSNWWFLLESALRGKLLLFLSNLEWKSTRSII